MKCGNGAVACAMVILASGSALAQTWDNSPPAGPVGPVGVCHIYAADAGPGGTYVLMGGRSYVIEDPLTVPVGQPLFDVHGAHVTINGQGNTITTQPGCGPVVSSTTGNPGDQDWFTFTLSDVQNLSGAMQAPMIDLPEGDHVRVEDVDVSDWDYNLMIDVDDFAVIDRVNAEDTSGDVIHAGNDAHISDCTARNVGGFAVLGDRGMCRNNQVVNTTGTVITAGDSLRDSDSKYAEFGQGYNVGNGTFARSLTACDTQDPPPTGPIIDAGAGTHLDSVHLTLDSTAALNPSVLEMVRLAQSTPTEFEPSSIVNSTIRTVPRTSGTAPSAVSSSTPLTMSNCTISVSPDPAAAVTHDPLVSMLNGADATLTNCTITSGGRGSAVAGSTVRASGCTCQCDQTDFSAVVDTYDGEFHDCDIRVGRRNGPASGLPEPSSTQVALRGFNIDVSDCSLSGHDDDATALELYDSSRVTGCSIEGYVYLDGTGTNFCSNSVNARGPNGIDVRGYSHVLKDNVLLAYFVLQATVLMDLNGAGHQVEHNTFNGGTGTTCIDLTGASATLVADNRAAFSNGAGTFLLAGGNPNVVTTTVTNAVPATTDYRPNVVTSN